jgi:hypothetical protein
MAVAPSPILFLLVGRDVAKVTMFIVMVFVRPLVVIDDFVVIPNVVIAVIRVIHAVGMMMGARRDEHGRRQRGG